jgi:hypothetical protein
LIDDFSKEMTLYQVVLFEAVLLLATTVNGLSIIRLFGHFQDAEIGEEELNRLYYFFLRKRGRRATEPWWSG